MSTIARAYETAYQAQDAVKQLIDAGVSEDRIQVVAPDSGANSASAGLRAGKALSLHRDAEAYALALDKGHTIVLADTHFGTGMMMSDLMDKCGPVALDPIADVEEPVHKGTPMSFMLGMPVLIRNNPAPFSRAFGFSVEPTKRSFLSKWFGGELSSSTFSLSAMLGLPTLTSNGGTFFSKLGLPEIHQEHMGDSAMGIPLLSDNASPLSSKMGISTLSENATPLSRMFGLGVLKGQNDTTPGDPPEPKI